MTKSLIGCEVIKSRFDYFPSYDIDQENSIFISVQFCIVYCSISLFVLFPFATVLCELLRFTAYDYHIGMFTLFLNEYVKIQRSYSL